MNVADIRTIYAYNDWANKRLLDVARALSRADLIRDLDTSYQSVKGTLVHILWAEWIWLQRWHGESPKVIFLADAYADLESIASELRDIARRQQAFIDTLTDDLLLAPLAYVNLEGETWQYALEHVMQHVVNHSTYHRGQLVTLLRQLGCNATPTDFLVFFDELGRRPPDGPMMPARS